MDDRPFAAEFEKRWRIDLARSRQMTGHRPEADAGLDVPRGTEHATTGA